MQPIASDPALLDEPLAVLLRYSLIRRNKDDNTVSMHRLVQAMLKVTMDYEIQRPWAEKIVQAVNQAFPSDLDVETWPKCERYLPHAQACADLVNQYTLTSPGAGRLFNLAGYYLLMRALYKQAEPLLKQSLVIREEVLGSTHPETATSLHTLAYLYRSQGKYEQAEPLQQQALTIWEEVLGPMHPDTATGLNTLAMLYYSQGKYEQVEPLLKRALAVREEMLGPMHPDTAISLNNLAGFYWCQGKYEQVEPLLKQSLAILEEVLGSMHPNTAISLNNLAMLYHRQGRYERAEPLLKRALVAMEKALVPNHLATMTVRINQARLLADMKLAKQLLAEKTPSVPQKE